MFLFFKWAAAMLARTELPLPFRITVSFFLCILHVNHGIASCGILLMCTNTSPSEKFSHEKFETNMQTNQQATCRNSIYWIGNAHFQCRNWVRLPHNASQMLQVYVKKKWEAALAYPALPCVRPDHYFSHLQAEYQLNRCHVYSVTWNPCETEGVIKFYPRLSLCLNCKGWGTTWHS